MLTSFVSRLSGGLFIFMIATIFATHARAMECTVESVASSLELGFREGTATSPAPSPPTAVASLQEIRQHPAALSQFIAQIQLGIPGCDGDTITRGLDKAIAKFQKQAQ